VITANPHLRRSAFDPLRDLILVARVARVQTLLVVHPDLPARNVREFVALARERKGALSYPSSGIGSFQHMGVAKLVGDDMVHVPYGGAGALMPDLLANRVHAFCGAMNSLLPHVQSGRLRALAAMTPTRASLLPDVPSVVEAGFPDAVTEIWASVCLPAATPAPLVQAAYQALNALFTDPAIVTRLAGQGIGASMATCAEITAQARAESAANAALLKRLGIEPA
jgi:tripartite-type tricarboxylate transporter receptor subunit TctC